jgi:hypothetical protein
VIRQTLGFRVGEAPEPEIPADEPEARQLLERLQQEPDTLTGRIAELNRNRRQLARYVEDVRNVYEKGALRRRTHAVALNCHSVRLENSSPGRSTVLGKAGWLGESGKCCVSRQTAAPRW